VIITTGPPDCFGSRGDGYENSIGADRVGERA
jgi:hypothetical protein